MSESTHHFDFASDFVGQANIKVVGVGGAGGNALAGAVDDLRIYTWW